MYTLRQLQMFEAVSRKQSYSRAAEELGVSQPSVSVQIQELEKDLGVELFARSGRHTTLTEVGTIFYGRTVKILEDVEQSLVEVDGYIGLERGRLRLGATEALGMYVLPEFIARYSGEHPGIDVELTLESNEDILDGLQSGRLDVGFGDLEIIEEGPILAREIASTEFVLVTGRGHPLSLQQKINSDELTGEDFIIEGEGSPSFVGLEWLATGMRGATPTVTMQVGSCEALKQMVRAHLGITVTYRVCIEWEYAASQLHILEITDLGAQRALYQYQLSGRTPTAAAAVFLELTTGA
jgi:DNA-binding transcriptional LysR family regulator